MYHPLQQLYKAPVAYFPLLNKLTGNVNTSILLAEIIRLADKYNGVFYKYIVMPKDSFERNYKYTAWTTDLNISKKCILSSLKDITSKQAIPVEKSDTSKCTDDERIQYYCNRFKSAIITKIAYNRVTQYTVNLKLLEEILNEGGKEHIKLFTECRKLFITFTEGNSWEGNYTELKEDICKLIKDDTVYKSTLKEMIDFLLEEQLLYYVKECSYLKNKNLYRILINYFSKRYTENEYKFNFLLFDNMWYNLIKYSGVKEYRPVFKHASDIVYKYQKQSVELSSLLALNGLSVKLYCDFGKEYLGDKLKIGDLLDRHNAEKIVNKLVA